MPGWARFWSPVATATVGTPECVIAPTHCPSRGGWRGTWGRHPHSWISVLCLFSWPEGLYSENELSVTRTHSIRPSTQCGHSLTPLIPPNITQNNVTYLRSTHSLRSGHARSLAVDFAWCREDWMARAGWRNRHMRQLDDETPNVSSATRQLHDTPSRNIRRMFRGGRFRS